MLADRGLEAAISALADRSADPGHGVGRRAASGPPPPVETAAYFVAAEALANAAQARRRDANRGPHRARATEVLVVEVTDDGAGGADPPAAG